MSSSSRKRLLRQLDDALAEIERLKDRYQRGIEQLERSLRENLPPTGCTQWFALYLRVVDLGLEIRRGEIRHRSAQQVRYSCMHTTGIKGAKHSGLSIDDANAIFQMLEDRGAVSAGRLERYYMKMDTLDRDDIQLLDERLTECIERFLAAKSAFYSKLEMSGSDPHQSLLVYGGASQRGQVVARATRLCLSPSTCKCEEDAEPWEAFVINADADTSVASQLGSSTTQNCTLASGQGSTDAGESMEVDVGMFDIKRQYGYDESEPSGVDHRALAQEARELKRLKLVGPGGAVLDANLRVLNRVMPREVYKKMCDESGVKPKENVRKPLGVRNGSMQFDLSQIGFQSLDDLHAIAQVVSEVSSYVSVDELNVSNSFFNRQAFTSFCKLVQLPSVSKCIKKVNLRGLSLPRKDDFATLFRLFQSSGEIRELDISFNTLSRASAECLELLFRAHPRLERLVMVSCFPDPSRIDPTELADIIAAMRTALLSCSSGASLKVVCLDSNWVHHSWLSALLSPDSCAQELRLSNIKFVSLPEDEDVGMTADQRTTWGLHFDHLTLLTVSEATDYRRLLENSSQDGIGALVDELRRGFQVDFMQLKHLDLAIDCGVADQAATASNSTSNGVIELIEQVRDYGGLTSLSLSLKDSNASDAKLESLKQLVAGGLRECEAIRLSVGRIHSLHDLQELITDCALPKAQTAKLSVQMVAGDQDGDCFQATSNEDAKRLGRSVCASLCAPEQCSSLLTITLCVELLLQPGDQPRGDCVGCPIDSFFEEIERTWKSSNAAPSLKAGATPDTLASRECTTSKRSTTDSASDPTSDTLRQYERVVYSCCLTVQ